MNREEVINTLYDFKDEYGTSYSSAEPEAMTVIEAALDLYFKSKDEGNKNDY